MPRQVNNNVDPIGAYLNMASAGSFTANTTPGNSGNPCVAFHVWSAAWITLFITTSATSVITVYYSPDGTHWYPSANTLSLTGAVSGALDFVTGAPYIAFASSTNATISATGMAK